MYVGGVGTEEQESWGKGTRVSLVTVRMELFSPQVTACSEHT